VVAPVLWSSAGVVTRHIERAEPFEQVFWRSLFAFGFVLVSILAGRKGVLKSLRSAGWAGVFSGLMWATMFTAFVIALSLTTIANTLVTMSISPLLTVLFARMALKDPVPLRTWVAAAAAGIGILWMFSTSMDDSGHVAGMLVAFIVPLAAALNVVVLRASAARVDLVPAVMLGGALSCLIALPLALPFQATPSDVALLALLGVFQLGLPCMLLVVASRALLAPELALLGLLEVVLGPLWAWLGAGEVPARATLLGGAVVLAALAGNELAAFRRIMRGKLSVTRISG
jgi:drug/metabolite transporter (DMT)-like permease